ncbi:Vegetative incompatibility protein HET-E-1 [Rhizoctonia solani]|uniref:Vegetative incompatibility protein HET-E-1 n=1 Tax=Rhizoctonia solani TaxID=456999 RepID=A0A8H8P557_9AGAM|nr:Vegetative incompatibility protein HET-E-1 [Rhizoctonia solani]QRW25831.1 Vegetative incompatibility protein HET-E-1 [Rhizoctonia solani]
MPLKKRLERFISPFKQGLQRRLGRRDGVDAQSSTLLPAVPTTSQAMLTPGSGNRQATVLMSNNNIAVSSPTPAEPGVHWPFLDNLSDAISPVADAFGPLKAIFSDLIDCVHIYEMAAKDRQDYEALRLSLTKTLEELRAQFTGQDSPEMSETISGLCESIQQEINSVKTLEAEGMVRRHIRAGSGSDEVLGCYNRIHGYLTGISIEMSRSMHHRLEQQSRDLKEQARKAEEQTKKIEEEARKAEEHLKKTEELAKHIKSSHARSYLDRLCPSFSAQFNSTQAIELKRGECTAGTRLEVLANMRQWASIPGSDSGAVYWLNGMAGTGKTTIAYSLCSELEKTKQLGASFFCSRLLPECRDVNRIIPSIAYQLAQHSPVFGAALLEALERDPDIHTRVPAIQFNSLIAEPLLKTKSSLKDSLIVVIDALDECKNQESTKVVLSTLLYVDDSLHLPIRFFVSSRPEPEIHQEMRKRMNAERYSQLILHELDSDTVQTDIHKYIRAALAPMDQVSDSQITQLVGDCGVLFIYAATAVRYISYKNFTKDPYGRLQNVLNASSPGARQKDKAINDLYTVILKAALEDEDIDDTERKDILRLLHTIVIAQEPLTISALSGLLQLGSEDRVRGAIRPLWSVLHVTGSNELVTTLHASFPDYMLSKERSGDYWCDRKLYDSAMARLCLGCIAATRPRFNICGLDSSTALDKDVPNLDQKIQNVVPAHLLYACRYFAAHLESAAVPHELSTLVREFMLTQLLLWLEVMNLTGNIQTAEKAMRRVDSWAMAHTDTPELQELAHDAWCFTTSFGSNVVCASTPHIYVSMLPFWPSSRPISQAYKGLYHGLPEVGGTAMDMRQLAVLATWSFSKAVNCVVFSRDGSRVALASGWQVIVADAYSDRPIAEPLKGHTKTVTSVDFSPDGTRIVSGSDDWSIRVWDVETGQLVLGPLQGHSYVITSVQYSPDETCIASCSYDGTIRTWDATTGETKLVIETPEEHRSPIHSIRYSPDGAHIVAGLENGQLYVWQASIGALVLGPLQAHTHAVLSVDYSPDGTHTVSGSHDNTIRIWNSVDGYAVPGPPMEQNTAIRSVRYSPDGRHIASGSYDGTICVWDPQTCMAILGPLKAHSNSISSICYSPDGARIVSCAYNDPTVHAWDARRRQKALPVAEGCAEQVGWLAYSPDSSCIVSASGNHITSHTSSVSSVDYSPTGDQFASGSWDKTICTWDAQTGHMLLGPLTGHTRPVSSVAYSPDGTSLASGSGDSTIRVWSTRTGELILGPLEYHTSFVIMVRYSPTGTCIASCSFDKTICVWSAQTGDLILGPLIGHTDFVQSIDFSPDGTRIVSCSRDRTIRVWDIQTGQTVLGPLEDSCGEYAEVRYSPRGDYICSTQYNVIWVLNAHTGDVLSGPHMGHIDHVSSIAISPDGTRIVSGSFDRAIRVWDVDGKTSSISTASARGAWKLNDEGWAVGLSDSSRLLVWVPHDMRASLILPQTPLLISEKGCLTLDFGNAYIGNSWTELHRPTF